MRRHTDVEVVQPAGERQHHPVVLLGEMGELALERLGGGVRPDREHRQPAPTVGGEFAKHAPSFLRGHVLEQLDAGAGEQDEPGGRAQG